MADIFVSRRIFQEVIDMLKEKGHDVEVNDSSRILPQEELIEKTRGKEGLICLLNDTIDEKFLDACPDLKVVSNVAVGYDNIDVDAATDRGVIVTNTPGVLTDTTADLAFTLLMSAARRIPEADRYSREDKYEGWELMQPHVGVDVYGKTLGIVGMGRIGQAIAKRAHKGFDMNIIYTDIERRKGVEEEFGAKYVGFDEILKKSQFITIHVPLTPETEGMFGGEEFERMNDDAILVNAARGPIIDEDALAKAIKNDQLRGAAIDTFEDEPDVNSKLAEIEEFVVLTPHIGSASLETRLKMVKMAVENMIAGLKGKEPRNIINEGVL
ncbi:glyoxylate reductase [candidate division MSBL1 archaeon SCGC-AAA259A05]|uniref:Glyoxylate reductase n=1 Tax=candidate division MSBL1 archaeon SCGC-AAA259A05 TaxID=1698259 RepID=A0A133U2T1_9EURY|nr:glyoxylate reductase [candidate division MSBL1 archaeon SCGC-AAA259A05]